MPVPTFSEPTDVEKSIAEFQLAYASRMRRSQYYITERTKSAGESSISINTPGSLFQTWNGTPTSIGRQ